MATRADKYTQIQKKQEYFSDFLDNFDQHPINHQLARVTNEESVKQSLRNLILTNLGERLFQPTVGSDVLKALFEPNDIVTAQNLSFFIRNTITQNEPRVILNDVVVNPSPDQYGFTASIVFSLINNSNLVSLNVILKRVR